MIDNIVEMMQELTDLYRQINEESRKKKDGIVANQIEPVSEAVKQEWEILSEIANLEEKRGQAVAEVLGREYKAGESSGTLTEVEAISTDEEREALEAAAKDLREVVEEQRRLNTEIQSLVDLHLEYTNYMVNMVFQEPQVSTIYGNGGYEQSELPETGGLHGIIDSQV